MVKQSTDAIPRACKDVLHRERKGGTIVLLKLDNDQFFFRMSGLVAKIWKLIDGKRSVSKIREVIRRRYNPPEARFTKDLQKLLKTLEKEELIEFLR